MEYNNNNFYKEINGKQASDYISKLDYSIKNIDDRINYVKKRLGITEKDGIQFPDEFWENVFTQTTDSAYESDSVHYVNEIDSFLNIDELKKWCEKNKIDINKYLDVKDIYKERGGEGEWNYTHKDTSNIKLVLNKDKSLYSTSNIAIILEVLASYILQLDKRKNNSQWIKVYNSDKLFKRALKEEKLFTDVSESLPEGRSTRENKQEFAILSIPKNYKKQKNLHQLKNDEFEKIIKKLRKEYGDDSPFASYYDTRIKFKEKLNDLKSKRKEKEEIGESLTDEEKRDLRILKKHITLLKKDMIDFIENNKKPIVFKQPLKDQGCPTWDDFDELDKTHVKALLQVHRDMETIDFQSDLMCMLYDLQKVLEEIKLTNNQKKVLDLWINGYSIDKIADELNKKQPTISGILDSVVNKIVDVYEEKIEDWYYLNICKGKYKKCNRCGEIKLISKFNKEKNGKLGVKSICKKCSNKIKNK